MTIETNYPEMHGRSDAEITAEYSAVVKKYRVTSKSQLPKTKGVEELGTIGEIGANGVKNPRKGWFKYYFTEKAFDKFKQSNHVVIECLL